MSIASSTFVRSHLRVSTAEMHNRLDSLTGSARLDRSRDYGWFLQAHAAALIPLEKALEACGILRLLTDWPIRARAAALSEDLAAMNLVAAPIQAPNLKNDAALFGAAYVLEGSRLGARVLLSKVPDKFPTAYLRHGDGLRLWPSFLTCLETAICVRDDLNSTVAASRDAFAAFQRAFESYLGMSLT